MRNFNVCLIVGFSCLGACSKAAPEPESDAHPPAPVTVRSLHVDLFPADLSTDIGKGSPLIMYIDNDSKAVPQDALDEIVRSLTLRDVAKGIDLPFETHVLNAENNAGPVPVVGKDTQLPVADHPQRWRASIELVPSSPLSDGWYEFGATALPSAVDPAFSQTGVSRTDGRFTAKVNTASQPILRSVRIAKKGGGITRAEVEFSENVVEEAQALSVTVSSTSAACSYVRSRGDSQETTLILSYDCPGLWDAPLLSLQASALKTSTGAAPSLFDPAHMTDSKTTPVAIDLDFAKIADIGNTKTWRQH